MDEGNISFSAVKGDEVWSPFRTILLCFAILIVNALFAVVIFIAFIIIMIPQGEFAFSEANLSKYTGLIISVLTVVSTVVTVSMVILLINIRKGLRYKEYLALTSASVRATAVWLAVTAVWIWVSDLATDYLGCTAGEDIVNEIFATAVSYPLLWIAICIAAPLMEEILFRGFIYKGFQAAYGHWPAIIVTTIGWALLHAGYGACELVVVFISGILLGYIRFRTGSLYPCILLHAFVNCLSIMQIAGWI